MTTFDLTALATALGVTPEAARAALRSSQSPASRPGAGRKHRDRSDRPQAPQTAAQPVPEGPAAPPSRYVIGCAVCGAPHAASSSAPAVVLCGRDCTPAGVTRRRRRRERSQAATA